VKCVWHDHTSSRRGLNEPSAASLFEFPAREYEESNAFCEAVPIGVHANGNPPEIIVRVHEVDADFGFRLIPKYLLHSQLDPIRVPWLSPVVRPSQLSNETWATGSSGVSAMVRDATGLALQFDHGLASNFPDIGICIVLC